MDDHLDLASRRAEPDIVRLTRDLISAPSDRSEERISIRLQDAYERLGYDLIFRDNAGNLLAVVVGSASGLTLLFLSHLDTVRPQDATLNDQNRFSGRLRRGPVLGLGVGACKAALVAQVLGGHLFDKNVLSYSGNLVVAATVGDHDGDAVGTAHLLSETLPRLDLMPVLAVLGGPTGLALCGAFNGRADDSDPMVTLAREGLVASGWSDVGLRTWTHGCLKLSAAGSVLSGRHHIPTIGFGPGPEGRACGRDEFVTVEALRRAALGNASIARALLGSRLTGTPYNESHRGKEHSGWPGIIRTPARRE